MKSSCACARSVHVTMCAPDADLLPALDGTHPFLRHFHGVLGSVRVEVLVPFMFGDALGWLLRIGILWR